MSNLCTYLSDPAHNTKRLMDSKRVFCKLFFSLLLLLVCANYSFAATAAGYSEYYIPGSEDSMSLALRSLGPAPATNNTHALIAITAWSDNVTVYIDHWEDGIDFDPDNPAATADETFTLATTGTLLTLDNTPVGGILIPRNSANTYYDGGDRIYVAGGAVTVARVSYLEDRGRAIQSVAWEIYPVKPQLTTYVLPFGENLSGSFPDFLRTYVIVQATADNTTFTVDLDGNGTPDLLDQNFDGDTADPGDTSTVTLQAGQSFFIGNVPVNPVPMPVGARATINSGAIIQGSATLQVKFVVGDQAANFETRGLSAFPRGYWTKEYYAPVGDSAARITDIFLYNPHSSSITVNWETTAASGNFTIGAGATVSYVSLAGQLPIGGGVYLNGSDVFWGVSTIDSTGQVNEWAYSLLPSTLLYDEHFLGWAPGGADGNDSGVFLTVVQDNTTVFVDTDNDGTADQTYTLNRLQTQYITDPTDFDLSGAHFWATGQFSMAFGQNPDTAPPQATSGDLGYVAIPGTDFISLVLTVDKSVSPQVIPTASGSIATFTLTVNSQKYTIDGIEVLDMLPANWQYLGPTSITLPDMTTITTAPTITAAGAALPPAFGGTCPAGGGPCLTWDDTVLGNMAENQQITISFTAQTTAILAAGTLSQNRVKAVGTRTFGTPSQTQTFTTTDFAYVASGGPTITKTSGAADPVSPGDTIPYTVTVANPASAAANLTGVSIYDPLPAGTSYVAASGSVTCNRPSVNVRDEFASAAYNLNGPNNTANWSGDWTETDINGTAGPSAGFVWATGTALQFRYQASNYLDNLDTGFYNLSNGTNPWDTSPWTETGDDGAAGTGTIIVNGGGSNELQFGPGTVGRSVTRTAAVTGNSVSVNFALIDRGIDNTGEGVIAEYDIDGDAFGFREIRRITNNTLSFAFSPVCAALPCTLNTTGATYITLRFRDFDTGNGTYEAGDFAGVDTVSIAVSDAVGSQIQRTANLSSATSASLNFTYAQANLDVGADILVVEASSSPAGPFTTLATFNAGVPNVAPPYNIAAYISATTTIRFRVTSGFNVAGETLTIDNVDITYSDTGAFASGNPPDFLPSSAGCVIAPGSSLTLTFNVTVDDPFPSGQTIITNTASTSSVQIPMAVSASATNTVLVPSVLSASTGGRVWLDADGDGVQDIGEPGIPNIEVTLKDRFGTPVATTLTDGNGRYLFTGVTPGTGYYVEVTDGLPAGLSQTFPIPPGLNRTNSFDLVDGQVYTSADLGYRAAAGTASFGDQVWVDADADGIRDAGEVGIGGVTVRLYLDNNGDGVIDGGDTLVGTQITAPDGTYLFTGATATGTEDYLVSATTPAGYLATGATQFRYINVTAGSTLLLADFGFRGDTITTYTIRDRVWTDTNGDGIFDAGETGLAGVTIELLDASLNIIGTTTTIADGTFIFSGMAGGGADYTVRINDTGGILTDYYGTTSYSLALERAESNIVASIDRVAAPPPSYGFRALRSIGDTVFNDLNGNGVQDAGESGISGVVVSLYRDINGNGVIDGGDALVGSVATDAAGQYLFSGLANASYIVSVPTPVGFTFIGPGADSDGAAAGIQKSAIIAGGASVMTVDFGFQALVQRTVSGTVWDDLDADGVIDGSESGLSGVTLDILSGAIVVATVTTDASGNYTVPGLASGTYTVRITDINSILTGHDPTFEYGVGTAGPFDNQAPVDLTGGSIANVHFGFKKPTPTLVTLSDFSAYKDNSRLVLQWTTSSEIDTAGFYLFRLDKKTDHFRQINSSLLPALITSQQGGRYSLIDNGASLTDSNTYLLMEIEGRGGKNTYGPFTVMAGAGNALEDQYSSAPKAAGSLLGITPGSAGSQAKSITKYVDREGTIVIAAGSSSSPGTGSLVTNEVSDFKRMPKTISATKQAALNVRAEERAGAGILDRQRTGSMAKISVTKNGLYYMDSAEISSLLGLAEPKVRQLIGSGRLAISNQGSNVAYIPAEDMAGLFFYGQGIDSIYAKENVYWLQQGIGLQMDNRDGTGSDAVGYGTFTETIHAEEDKVVAPALASGPASDYWFWDYVIAGNPSLGTRLFDLQAYGVAGTSSDAILTIRLHGLTATGAANDHHVIISLNDTVIGEDQWKGAEERAVNLSISQGLLHNGTNQITVKGLLDTGAPYSVFFVDSFDLTYQRLLEAHEDSLIFRAADAQPLTVYGFTNPDLVAFDITDPNKPMLNMATTIDMAGGNYSVSFIPSPGSRYLVTASDAAAVVNAWADSPSSLRSGSNQADYVIITTRELIAASGELADYRQRQGLTGMVVDLEDIMDEFNYGISNPEVIHEFLVYAHVNWKKAPKYVLLAGAGTYDYRDNMAIGDNLVPTLMAETPWFITPSDNLYADMDGDHLPDIAIGRLPVLTAKEMRSAIKKIITYESTAGNRVIMLADNQDDGGNFPSDSDDLAALLPTGYSVEKIYLSEHTPAEARQHLFNEVRTGAVLLNYTGHAGIDTLAAEGLLSVSDVATLQNSGKPFVLAAMTCSVGNFALPGYNSLSEALVTKESGGAVAVWAPTGLSYNYLSKTLNEQFFRSLIPAQQFFRAGLQNQKVTLGNVIVEAFRNYKITGGPAYIMDIYNLQGDPALRLW